MIKDNRMIEASYTLDLVEQRIVLMSLAWARQHELCLTHDTWVELRAIDYAELYAVDLVTAYRQLKLACESLQQRKINISGIDRATGAPARYTSNWVNPAIYVDTVGLVRLRFDEMLVPYVSNLESHFTSYQLGSICGLSSAYAIRLYEMLCQYKKIGERTISIVDLRDTLECNNIAYDRLDNFKRRVIDPSIEQINSKTDLDCHYETEKLGKRVVGLIFQVSQKQPSSTSVQLPITSSLSLAALPSSAPKDRSTAIPRSTPSVKPTGISAPLTNVLSTAERSMLRQLQQTHPELTEFDVIQQAQEQQTDVFMVLATLELSR